MHGLTCIFWTNLTPFSLKLNLRMTKHQLTKAFLEMVRPFPNIQCHHTIRLYILYIYNLRMTKHQITKAFLEMVRPRGLRHSLLQR